MLLSNESMRQTLSNGVPLTPPATFDSMTNDLPHVEVAQLTHEPVNGVEPWVLATSNGAGSVSPASSWLYNELSKDHNITHSASESLVVQKERVSDSLWDLQETVDLFVTGNKEGEQWIFPRSFDIDTFKFEPEQQVPIQTSGLFNRSFDSHLPQSDVRFTILNQPAPEAPTHQSQTQFNAFDGNFTTFVHPTNEKRVWPESASENILDTSINHPVTDGSRLQERSIDNLSAYPFDHSIYEFETLNLSQVSGDGISATELRKPSVDGTTKRHSNHSNRHPDSEFVAEQPKRPRICGNNIYGRRGNFRCMRCRLRRSKCIYTSFNLPCHYCRSKGFDNCRKVSARGIGPKIQLDENSRLPAFLPTIAEQELASMRGRHRQVLKSKAQQRVKKELLSYIFKARTPQSADGGLALTSRVNRQVLIIPCAALENAVLAWATRQLPPEQFEESVLLLYQSEALHALRDGISTRVTEGELFASNVLGWVAYSTNVQDATSIYMRGSMLMLRALWEESQKDEKLLSDAVQMFGPFIIDCATIWSARNGATPRRMTTFQQRVNYFDHLRRLSSKLAIHSGVREALSSSLGNLLELLLFSLSKIARRENEGEFSNEQERNYVLQWVEAELGDIALHRSLVSVKREFQAHENLNSVEEQWTLRLFHRLRCILLLHSILSAPTVWEGIDSTKTTRVATSLISLLRSQSIPRWAPIRDYYLISWHNYSHLLLGGMALSNGDCPGRNDPVY